MILKHETKKKNVERLFFSRSFFLKLRRNEMSFWLQKKKSSSLLLLFYASFFLSSGENEKSDYNNNKNSRNNKKKAKLAEVNLFFIRFENKFKKCLSKKFKQNE